MKRLALCTGLSSALAFATPVGAADLMEAFEMALQSDPELRAAQAQVRSVREVRTQARANFLPQLSGTGSFSDGEGSFTLVNGTSSDTDSTRENYSVNLTQTIYDRRNYAQLKSARAQVSQSEADYLQALNDFRVRIAERYFAVLTAEDALTFAEAELKANERQLEQAEQRYEVGLTAITDVFEARASYDGSRARVIQANNSVDDALEALTELTGEELGSLNALRDDVTLEPPTPADPEAWVETALATNPALLSSRRATEAARANIESQRSQHWPTLSFGASYSDTTNAGDLGPFSTETSDSLGWQVTLNVPIYSGGAVSSRARQAVADYQAASEREEQQRRATRRQARNAYRAVIAGISEAEARKQTVLSAQKALEATEAGFEVGTRTIVDVLLSQRTLFSAQSDYSQARHSLILDSLRLKQAAGTLEPSDIQAVNGLLR